MREGSQRHPFFALCAKKDTAKSPTQAPAFAQAGHAIKKCHPKTDGILSMILD